MISPGVITILCHGKTFLTPIYFGDLPNDPIEVTGAPGDMRAIGDGRSPEAEGGFAVRQVAPARVDLLASQRDGDFGDHATIVTVKVREKNIEPRLLRASVAPVNDAPVITGQVSLVTAEEEAIALELSHLIIQDPDSESFTMSILGGENYTVSGNLVTPASAFNGTLTVKVFVNDGEANSNIFDLRITVTAVNDAPVITGHRAIRTEEGTPVTLSLADLTVADEDNTFPADFTLEVLAGENYTFSDDIVTPAADFTGSLYVNVLVNDGTANSLPYALPITVTPLNDPPVITGQQAVSTNEETARTIQLADLIVNDPDNAYPTGFTLQVFPGEHYTLTGNTVSPAPDFSGSLTVPVQVSDGTDPSNIFDLKVDVVAVNDKPVITGQVPLQTPEDAPLTIAFSHLTVFDPDNTYPTGFTMSVFPGANYTVNGTTVQPTVDFHGALSVPVVVNDGVSDSDPFNLAVQVGDDNDVPVITGQAALSTDEEQPVVLALSHLTVLDPDNTYPSDFTLLVSPGANYTVSGSTITPALDFAGVLTVPVSVNDGATNSLPFDFQLQVNQINDPPSFAEIPDQQIAENATAGSLTIRGISKGPMEDDQELTLVATSSNTNIVENPVVLYNGKSKTARLSYVVKPNVSGVVTITIVAIDNGSSTGPHKNSYTDTFQVEVLEINTAPTLDKISDITIMEDAEQQNISLTGISAGVGETQTINVAVSVDKPDLFDLLEVNYTSPQTEGLIRFKTKANLSGNVEFTVKVTDDGPATAPNVNSTTRKFSLVIQPVNDPPTFTSQPVILGAVQEEYRYVITATDPDGDKLTYSAPVKPAWASLSTAENNGQATLRGRPPAAATGNASVTLQLKDGHLTVEQSFSIYVNVRPLVQALSVETDEDTPLSLSAAFFSSGYEDQNENTLQGIQVTQLPVSGRLLLAAQEVKAGDTIAADLLPELQYVPSENYFGKDSFAWNAFDGYHFSAVPAYVDISVLGVNDPPRLILQQDTLRYEVNGEPALLSPLVEIEDPDDDTLTNVSIAFVPMNYRPEMDMLQYDVTPNIRAAFDFQTGVLRLTGAAPVESYLAAIRSVRYLHQNTIDPVLESKAVAFTLNDGESQSQPVDMVIVLQYTFVEFQIPTGFTPNGDQSNDTWVIDRPGGGLEEMNDAVISVYNKQGVLVYRTKGFDHPWDGRMNGELLPADTYFFTIDLQLRSQKTYKGVVTILR